MAAFSSKFLMVKEVEKISVSTPEQELPLKAFWVKVDRKGWKESNGRLPKLFTKESLAKPNSSDWQEDQ